ncbi:uncharacterized protein K452DRAFT_291919 [Aplosporella prunicola CBS 121167]|uniref:Uncharacterized protein n=1 Tax=Aplosporella prunicola CBS 121167 TaxID=1176127 RepID=A0A6A6B1A4_9PEZI|nr:uncharacterized protein K452DRAFT_291919 [Aplosporella prunicola CBS 121167]KAF2137004.1 hypothetical protein K452DRAFT_291919 [Aplosporella prunicola CBS 121167]
MGGGGQQPGNHPKLLSLGARHCSSRRLQSPEEGPRSGVRGRGWQRTRRGKAEDARERERGAGVEDGAE